MTKLLERLSRDHENLARLLALIDRLLDQFHAGIEPDYVTLCEALEYLDHYADQVHHPSEELIFQRIRERVSGIHPVLDQLTCQHQLLSQINRRFRQSLDGIIHGEVLRRSDVERQGRELVQALREHLDLEESDAFPLARQTLSVADWDALAQVAPHTADPLFATPEPVSFRALYQRLMDAAAGDAS